MVRNAPMRRYRPQQPVALSADRYSKGATLLEYALLATLIAVVALAALAAAGASSSDTFWAVGRSFPGAANLPSGG